MVNLREIYVRPQGVCSDNETSTESIPITSVAYSDPDPGSGAFFDPWIRDPEWVKNPDPGLKTRIIFPRASKQYIFLG